MDKVYYKNDKKEIRPEEKIKYIEITNNFMAGSTWVNIDTGEIREYYPNICFDRRERKREAKESNPNSYASRLQRSLGESAYFYTIHLYDFYPSWGEYKTIFDYTTLNKVKNRIRKITDGCFMANFEISSFVGAHCHIITGKQVGKYFKAERECWDYFGAVE